MLKELRIYNKKELEGLNKYLDEFSNEVIQEKRRELSGRGIKMLPENEKVLRDKVSESINLHIFVRGRIFNRDVKVEKTSKDKEAPKK